VVTVTLLVSEGVLITYTTRKIEFKRWWEMLFKGGGHVFESDDVVEVNISMTVVKGPS